MALIKNILADSFNHCALLLQKLGFLIAKTKQYNQKVT
jgi:hypothetical protein